MSKVYILLRNNKQTGPYSLEELIALGLKRYDLVWIEGKTACWLYPSEIDELKPYAPEKKAEAVTEKKTPVEDTSAYQPVPRENVSKKSNAPQKVYVSLPTNPADAPAVGKQVSATPILEQRAEELRKRIQAHNEAKVRSEVDPSAAKSLEQKAEELRRRALAGASEAKVKSEVDPSAAQSLEQKAEELRKRALAAAPEAKVKSEVDASAARSLEQKAEAVRSRALAQVRQKIEDDRSAKALSVVGKAPKEELPAPSVAPVSVAARNTDVPEVPKESIQTKYSRSLEDAENEYTSWVYKTRSKKKSKIGGKVGAIAMAVMLVGLCLSGIYFAFFTRDTAGKEFTVIPSENVNKVDPTAGADNVQQQGSGNDVSSNEKSVPKVDNENTVSEIKNDPAKLPEALVDREKEAAKGNAGEQKKPVPVVNEPRPELAAKKTQDIVVSVPPTQRPAETTNEDVVGGNADQTGERKARRRTDEPATAAAVPAEEKKVDMSGFIDLISSESPGNWMMGVRGVKLTLLNRSQQMVKKADIEVRYYNEHEEVLEKKIVNVTNIQPERSVLVSVPDHRLADHADYRLISATN